MTTFESHHSIRLMSMVFLRRTFLIVIFCCQLFSSLKIAAQYSMQVGRDTFFLEADERDTSVVLQMLGKFSDYRYNNASLSRQYAEKALGLAQKLAYRTGIAMASVSLGDLLRDNGLVSQAHKHYLSAYTQYKKLKNITGQVDMFYRIGDVFETKGELSVAMEDYYKALRLAEKHAYSRGIADALFGIARVQEHQGLEQQAKETFERVMKIVKEIGYSEMVGNIYNYKGRKALLKGDYKESVYWFKKYIESVKNNADPKVLSMGYNNLGIAYKKQGQYQKAMELYKKSIAVSDSIRDIKSAMFAENSIGELFFVQHDYNNALLHKKKGLGYARVMGATSMIMHLYKDIFNIYIKKGAFRKATDYMRMMIKLSDTINIQNINEKTAEMQAKYDSERKQRQIEIQKLKLNSQELDLKKSRIEKYALFGGLGFTLLVALLLYNRYNVKKRTNKELEVKNTIIEKQNRNIVDSINYAQRIQRSMLIDEKELKEHFKDIFIYYKPKDIVSGDFYWYAQKDGQKIIAVADCTGHGVPGAFVSMIGNMLLREIVMEKNIIQPNDILASLHEGIINALQQERIQDGSQDGMDISVCSVSPDGQRILYSGAMNPVYVISKNQLDVIKPDICSVGGKLRKISNYHHKVQFSLHEIRPSGRTLLYLFTDGFPDQFGGRGSEKFGTVRFKQMLLKNSAYDMQAQKEMLASTMYDWMKDQRQIDDMLVMGIEI